MEGIKGYSRPGKSGGVVIDIEAMLVDLIMACKAGGIPKEEFIEKAAETWNEVQVQISIPKANKN